MTLFLYLGNGLQWRFRHVRWDDADRDQAFLVPRRHVDFNPEDFAVTYQCRHRELLVNLLHGLPEGRYCERCATIAFGMRLQRGCTRKSVRPDSCRDKE